MATSKSRPGTDEIGITDEDLERVAKYLDNRSPHNLAGEDHTSRGRDVIDDSDCAALREAMDHTQNMADLANSAGAARSTVEHHVKGQCLCSHDEPPRQFDGNSGPRSKRRQPAMSELDPTDTVLIAGYRRCIHTDPDCDGLDRANKTREVEYRAVKGKQKCKECFGNAGQGGTEGGVYNKATREKLAELDPEDLGLTPMGERASVAPVTVNILFWLLFASISLGLTVVVWHYTRQPAPVFVFGGAMALVGIALRGGQ